METALLVVWYHGSLIGAVALPWLWLSVKRELAKEEPNERKLFLLTACMSLCLVMFWGLISHAIVTK